MKHVAVIAMAALLLAGTASAKLCSKCKGKAYTEDTVQCSRCKTGWTGSGAFKLCKACSAKLGQCEHCRAALKPDKPKPAPATQSAAAAAKAPWVRLAVHRIKQPSRELVAWLAKRKQIGKEGDPVKVALLSDKEVKQLLAMAEKSPSSVKRAGGDMQVGKSGVVDLTRTRTPRINIRGGRGHHASVQYRDGSVVNVRPAGDDPKQRSLAMSIEYLTLTGMSDGPTWEEIGKAAVTCEVSPGKTFAIVIPLRRYDMGLVAKVDPETGAVAYTLDRSLSAGKAQNFWTAFLVRPATIDKPDGKKVLPPGPVTIIAASAPERPPRPLFQRTYYIADLLGAAREKEKVQTDGGLAVWLLKKLESNGLKQEQNFQLNPRRSLRAGDEHCRIVATRAEHAQVVTAMAAIRKQLGLKARAALVPPAKPDKPKPPVNEDERGSR